jgi:hypothetical protein
MATFHTDLEKAVLLTKTVGYRTTVLKLSDRTKVAKAIAGERSLRPGPMLAQIAWELANEWHALHPPAPPPPPVPTYLKVAPITVREEGGSDQRVCLFEADGTLRPGVRRLPNGQYTDESGALYSSDSDGLEDSSIRTKVHDPALVGARSMDNRSTCDCPPTGDPTTNTGSWTV